MRRKLPLALAEGVLLLVIALAFSPTSSACPCGTSCRCGPGCSCGAPPPAPGPPSGLQVRKNATSLTAQEKQDFVNAVLTLKTTFRPGQPLSIYDTFVLQHNQEFLSHQAHEGPAFLPWHRQFVLEFERELQRINPRVTVPYWDFSVDTSPTAAPWTPDFMGGNGDPFQGSVVVDGPFRQGAWRLALDGPDLRRQFGVLLPTLPTPEDVARAFLISQYDAPPWGIDSPIDDSIREYLEGFGHPSFEPEMHNRVHLWLGGSSSIINSPNDPIFWLLHANIDRIWSEWQARYGLTYLPTMGGPPGHNLHDPMRPFGVTPAQTLDHYALGYRYDSDPLFAVPEPSAALLLGLGGLALVLYRRKRRKENEAMVG